METLTPWVRRTSHEVCNHVNLVNPVWSFKCGVILQCKAEGPDEVVRAPGWDPAYLA
jgi:hypothetical protein